MFKGKNIILGVTSSIAAYKSANVASALVKKGCNVNVLMTENATNFINPLTFEELTKHKCIIDTFDRNVQYNVAHISLAVSADAFIIAPASANVIGKIANGIADDMLTTTVMACKCPVIISPAMNTNMYENPIVQDNLAKLERFGYIIVPPAEGRLACGTIGKGKMPDEQVLLDYLERALSDKQDFKGKRVLVTAGPTQESIDPVRYITNHSSGKMGYAVARQAMLRGAEVTLVSGKVNLPPVPFVKMIYITTAEDMYNAVTAEFENTDIVIKAAAVADFRPKRIADDKLKKADAFPSWIFKILHSSCIKYIDLQAKSRANSDFEDMKNDVSLSDSQSDLSLDLKNALNLLNNDEKDIVLLCAVAGFTSKECSKIIGLKPSSVRSKLSRSLAKMRNYLE